MIAIQSYRAIQALCSGHCCSVCEARWSDGFNKNMGKTSFLKIVDQTTNIHHLGSLLAMINMGFFLHFCCYRLQ